MRNVESPICRGALVCCLMTLTACSGPDPVIADSGGDFELLRDSLACAANNDGKIELDELLFQVGASASYRVNPPGTLAAVDNQGRVEDGKQVWDHSSLSGVVAGIKVESVDDTWYAKHFPEATFAVGQEIKAETLEVLRLDPVGQRLLLLGLVSRKADVTLMVYQPPIEIMRFPLYRELKFTSTGEVHNGTLNNLPMATRDTYEVEVDGEGTVILPSLKLLRSLRQKVRVRIQTVGQKEVHAFQYQWFHECFGEVVRAVAPPTTDNSWPGPTFDKATEYRRLSF